MNAATALLIERDQDLVTVTMNRPPANALNAQLIVELLEAIRRFADDEKPPGIVLTGGGDRFFSAGGDIKEVVGIDVARPRIRFFHELLVAMENYPGPIVCAVRGYAVGGALPEQTRLFTGHDYQPGGRNPRWESSVAEQKQSNHHLVGMTEDRFVTVRTARDKTMPMPKLILHALQVNLRAGQLPDPENNGRRYLKVPIGALADAAW